MEKQHEPEIQIFANSALPPPHKTHALKNDVFFDVMLDLFAQTIIKIISPKSSGELESARRDARLLMSVIRRFYKDERGEE